MIFRISYCILAFQILDTMISFMKKLRLTGFCAIALPLMTIAACSNKGDCMITYTCPDSEEYETSTLIYDVTENDCEEYASDFEQGGKCTAESDWQQAD